MQILVDADACPKAIKEIIYRAAKRTSIMTTLFANAPLSIPPSPFLKFVQVPKGFDVVDHKIVECTNPGDLVITADIPLAAAVIAKQGLALNPRGEFYTPETIQQALAIRNLMTSIRDTGQRVGGPAPLNQKDNQAFANALDRFLAGAASSGRS